MTVSYTHLLTEAQLRNRFEPDKGLVIAESPKVIKVALDVGYEPLALLCEHKHIYGEMCIRDRSASRICVSWIFLIILTSASTRNEPTPAATVRITVHRLSVSN